MAHFIKNPLIFRNQEDLSINVFEDSLVMYGTPEDSSGCVLRGYVDLNLSNLLITRGINLRFVGKTEIFASYKNPKQTYLLVDRSWPLVRPNKDKCYLPPNKYHFEFEIPVSGRLPESVQVPGGVIEYTLFAEVEKVGFHFNIQVGKTLQLKRAPHPISEAYLTPSVTSISWLKEQVFCSMSTEMPVYDHHEQILVEMKIRFLERILKIKKIEMTLEEIISYPTFDGTLLQNSSSIVKTDRFSFVFKPNLTCKALATVAIPQTAIYDSTTKYIRVRHRIIGKIIFCDHFFGGSELYLNLGIVLRSREQSELLEILPSYKADDEPPCYPGPSERENGH
ncbi:hypothetical protein K493DRAFT_307935 [Basidiobolus meristosporus CBS 931.73]|uniref:Arrestin-like N-terminal domain-containing protein n=1 Tax=Basidiobolus meristosporus CBS 931.73 TaxID=1314790 RepID=A0A1Y1X8B8_9FUNG|nr:hypothetical protein K493DRAFT_307935 [Basidiobolus meristosporus CBS 931.73]|eukprot:ORX82001.1 hypothetical protein K493DRAFT_307935 [Basidiobolus meristosporus CBS 931.73]